MFHVPASTTADYYTITLLHYFSASNSSDNYVITLLSHVPGSTTADYYTMTLLYNFLQVAVLIIMSQRYCSMFLQVQLLIIKP